MRNNNSLKLMAAVVIVIGLVAGAAIAADSSVTGTMITPDQLTWKASPRVVGLENADMIGNSSKEGAYIYRVKFPANFKMEAHSHPEDRNYTIISGTWNVGWGEKFDAAKLTALPPGSFYTEPANVPHFLQAGDEPVVVQISGTGPSGVKYVDPANAPQKK
jgi:uncharacterized RmlC-like cupin family protein